MSLIRILLVDDLEKWRRFVVSMLRTATSLQVICEVSDGLDAIQKAQQLKPDLILLDIGLPRLNGMDAARQLCGLASKPKILFLSQESDPDVVREALQLGAGFVVKTDAGKDLLPAVEAVMGGEQFLSRSLAEAQLQ